jgi:DNA polymerase III delta subunit
MEITEVKSHIQKKTFNPFYIFSGPEWKVQRLYIDQISKTSEKELRYIESISDIYAKRNNAGFIKKNYVYVVRDDKEILQNEKVQAQLNSIIGKNILVLILTSVDKRLKFYKQYKDDIVDFEPLKPEILRKYIQKDINLSNKNCDKLMEFCEYDYGRCLLEIDKIKNFVAADKSVDGFLEDSAFTYLLQYGLIYQPPKDAIFDFVDAILDDKVDLSFELYHQCLAVGEATMVMISVLYNNAKAVLQVQSCKSRDVSKSTGLTAWQIKNAEKHRGKRSISDLLYIMKICQKSQQDIVTGVIDEELVMERILTEVM